MPSVALHKNIMDYQEKVYGGITSRQLAYAAAGVAAGAAAWGACSLAGLSFETSATVAMSVVVPVAMAAMWEPDGLDPVLYARIFWEHASARQRLLYLSESEATEGASAARARASLVGTGAQHGPH